MRILTVCTSTNVFGAEVVTLNMLEGFIRTRHAQLAVTSIWTDREVNRRLARLGVPELRLPFGAFSKRLASQPLWWTANTLVRLPWLWTGWLRAVRKFRPDVILWTSSRLPLLVWPWIGKQPSFLIEYTSLEPTRTRRSLYVLLARKLSGFIAVSDFMREHLHRVGAPRHRIHVVKSAAFSEAEVSQIEKETAPNQNHSPTCVGIVGQIAPHKGHDCLVATVRLLKNRGCEVSVNIFGVGATEYVSRLKGKIADYGLTENFHWKGYQRNRAEIYRSIDICVVPSCFDDPFPTVAMEAGAYGLPVVASRVGGLPEIIENGVTGWLVNPNEAEQFADKIEHLICNAQHAGKMGLAGRRRIVQQFTQEKMIASFEKLFADYQRKDLPKQGV